MQGICAANGATCTVGYTHEFAPTVNDTGCVAVAVRAATAAVGVTPWTRTARRSWRARTSACSPRAVPGCFAFIGQRHRARPVVSPLHSRDYDFNDDILEAGMRYYVELARVGLPAGAPE